MQRTRRALPAVGGAQGRGGRMQYDPWNSWQVCGPTEPQAGVGHPQPAVHLAMYPQTYQQPYQQANPEAAQHAWPFVIPAATRQQRQQPPTMVTPYPVAVSTSSIRPYAKHNRKTSTVRSSPPHPVQVPKPMPARSREPRERKVDYIHFVDELPHIIKESLKKEPPASALSSSSSSSSSSDAAEEVPRASIPQAIPRSDIPLQFPQYPSMETRWAVPAPTNFPRQWSRNGDVDWTNDNARYASPHTRTIDRRARSGEGNTPSCFDVTGMISPRRKLTSSDHSDVPTTERAKQRREYVMRSWGRERGRARGYRKRGYGRKDVRNENELGEREREDTKIPKEPKEPKPPSKTARSGDSAAPRDTTTKQAAEQPPAYNQVLHLSPIPLHIVEEPSSESESTQGKKPYFRGRSTSSTESPRPAAPLVTTPFLDVRPLSASPQSAASNLRK